MMGKGHGSSGLSSALVALVQKEDWAELSKALKSDSTAAQGSDNASRTLLHLVLWKQAPEELSTTVFEANEGAAESSDRDGRYPLHFAMCASASPGLVAKVLKAAPAAAKKADKRGRMPLHYAMWRQAPVDVVSIVHKAHPEAAETKDGDKQSPLDYENEKGPRPAVLAVVSGEDATEPEEPDTSAADAAAAAEKAAAEAEAAEAKAQAQAQAKADADEKKAQLEAEKKKKVGAEEAEAEASAKAEAEAKEAADKAAAQAVLEEAEAAARVRTALGLCSGTRVDHMRLVTVRSALAGGGSRRGRRQKEGQSGGTGRGAHREILEQPKNRQHGRRGAYQANLSGWMILQADAVKKQEEADAKVAAEVSPQAFHRCWWVDSAMRRATVPDGTPCDSGGCEGCGAGGGGRAGRRPLRGHGGDSANQPV